MVEHRRRQIERDSHFGVGQRSHVATDGGLRAAKGRHGKGVCADLRLRFVFFDQGVAMIRGYGWNRETFYKEERAHDQNTSCCYTPLYNSSWCDISLCETALWTPCTWVSAQHQHETGMNCEGTTASQSRLNFDDSESFAP